MTADILVLSNLVLNLVAIVLLAAVLTTRRQELRERDRALLDLHAAHLDDLREALRHERERTTPNLVDFARTLVMGTPTPAEASTFEVVDPESQAQRKASEQSIQRGVSELREAYIASGQRVPSDDELRAEAQSILLGVSPV